MKIQKSIVFGLVVSSGLFCNAQTPIQAASQALKQPSLMEQMKKSVLLLETDCLVRHEDGSTLLEGHAGTAFLLAMPDARLPGGGSFTYLVTNHHVAAPGIENRNPCNVARYVIRYDLKNPDAKGSYTETAVVPSAAMVWQYPTDDSIDLAITPIGFQWDKVDIVALPSTLLLSSEDVGKNGIEEGDSVFFAGVFAQMIGQTHSEPIVREGKVAMVPREPVPTTLRPTGDVFLVDCHVFGGNSGSPMFVNLAGQRQAGLFVGVNYKLLGVVSGYVTEGANFELQTVASYAGTVAANSGVAIVVPAQKVLDLLDSPALKTQRDNGIAALSKQH